MPHILHALDRLSGAPLGSRSAPPPSSSGTLAGAPFGTRSAPPPSSSCRLAGAPLDPLAPRRQQAPLPEWRARLSDLAPRHHQDLLASWLAPSSEFERAAAFKLLVQSPSIRPPGRFRDCVDRAQSSPRGVYPGLPSCCGPLICMRASGALLPLRGAPLQPIVWVASSLGIVM